MKNYFNISAIIHFFYLFKLSVNHRKLIRTIYFSFFLFLCLFCQMFMVIAQVNLIATWSPTTTINPSTAKNFGLLCLLFKNRLACLSDQLITTVFPSRHQMVDLQDSAKNLQKLPIWQHLTEKWLSCKICQKNGYLARFFQVQCGRAVLLLALIHETHLILTRNLLKNQLRVFFLKIKNLNRFSIWKYELTEENKLKSAF